MYDRKLLRRKAAKKQEKKLARKLQLKNMIELEQFDDLKILKKYEGRANSEYVHLLEGNIIKKQYSNKKAKHIDHFNREVNILTHLKEYPYATKLLKVDYNNLILFETYCGKQPKRTAENAHLIRKQARELHKKWGVVRRDPISGKPIYNIFFGNTALKKGKIYFFDFGGNKWHIEKPSNQPLPIKKRGFLVPFSDIHFNY